MLYIQVYNIYIIHALQIATQGILKYCLRGMLGKQQEETLIFFLDTVTLLLSESQIQRIKGTHHIVDRIEQFGPVYSTWMYSYERFNSWMSRLALYCFKPEATIMETYRVRLRWKINVL